jgi:transposase
MNLTLAYGRSPKGRRVNDTRPTSPGTTVNAAAAMGADGIATEWLFTGPLTAERLVAFFQLHLLGLLSGGKVLILDNHPVHRSRLFRQFLDDSGVRYIFLPPYSPELNPIEEAFSKVKNHVKKQKPRTVQSLCDTIKAAFFTITESDAIGFFNHAESFRAALC